MSDETAQVGCGCLGWILAAVLISLFFPVDFWQAFVLCVIVGILL